MMGAEQSIAWGAVAAGAALALGSAALVATGASSKLLARLLGQTPGTTQEALLIAALIAAIVLLVVHGLRSAKNDDPLAAVAPADPRAEDPLSELAGFAQRSAERLHSTYNLQRALLVSVQAVLVVVIGTAVYLVAKGRESYGALFGAGGVGAFVFGKTWEPYGKALEASKAAARMDILATAVVMRQRDLAKIEDPRARSDAMWNAALDFTRELREV